MNFLFNIYRFIFIDFCLRGHCGIVDASFLRFHFLCGSGKLFESGQIFESLFGVIEEGIEVVEGVEKVHGALL
jgi:hypothetical protein